jgi:hypothetical protein
MFHFKLKRSYRVSSRKIKFAAFALLFALMGMVLLIFFAPDVSHSTSFSNVEAAGGATYFVSKNGNNSSGLSWATAWNELDQINWSKIQPGDTIFIDGGASGMTYNTLLTVGQSGTAAAPITIARSSAAGHNGAVSFFGGRSIPLPYCGQPSYNNQTQGVLDTGIDLGDNAYVTIDGGSWHGISVFGYDGSGVTFGADSHNDTMRNLYVYDDGSPSQESNGTWIPEGPHLIDLHGSNHIFQYMDLDDGGEDAFQPTNINDITIQFSWLHDSRSNPNDPGSSFNQCDHNDGMQLWTGDTVSNLTFDQDVLGPTKENGLILGNGLITVNNVTVTNTLIIDADANNIWGDTANGWKLDHITSFAQNQNVILEGSDNSITNSLFYGGLMSEHGSLVSDSNNCQWQTTGDTLNGHTANPQFASNLAAFPQGISTDLRQSPTAATLQSLSFAPAASSACAGTGASITSVNSFLQIVGAPELPPPSGAIPTPKPKPTPKPLPTQNPVSVATTGPVTIVAAPRVAHTVSSQHPSQKPTGPQDLPLWIALGLALLACIALSLYLFLRRNQKLFKHKIAPVPEQPVSEKEPETV